MILGSGPSPTGAGAGRHTSYGGPMNDCLALIRVRVPDRPGALGLVASRIGALRGDIVGVEVLDRSDGVALDELAVILPNAEVIPALGREIAEVDGTETESITV